MARELTRRPAATDRGTTGDREREFFERSLADLEREHAAGDITDDDYRRLRDKYRRRLKGEPSSPRPPARPALVVASVGFVVLVAVLAGVLVARSAGRRVEGGTITGGGPVATAPAPGTGSAGPEAQAADLDPELARCAALAAGEAIDCYSAYTSAHPDDPDGFTQFGLFAIQAGMANGSDDLLDAGKTFLERALVLDPNAVEARVFLAVVLNRTGGPEAAAAECERLAGADIPAGMADLVNLACGGTGP